MESRKNSESSGSLRSTVDTTVSNEKENLETASSEAGTWFSSRYCLCYLALVGFANVYALRVNLSVAILSMVNTTNGNTNHSIASSCPENLQNTTVHKGGGQFDWDEREQGLILGAFFYGYIFTQIPGGYLAGRFGGKLLFGGGVLCTAVLTLLTPLAAKSHVGFLVALRVVEGFGEGVTFPAMHAMLGRWAPPVERTFLVSLSYAGSQLGTVISQPISGVLCDAVSWESVFYIFGALGVLWCVVWFIFAHNSPEEHPRISEAERAYITSNVTPIDKSVPTPWLEIATSKPVWGISIAHFCNNWGFYTLLTCLPKYLKDILHFDIANAGFASALPYLVMWIMINVVGVIADRLRGWRILNTTQTRKLFNSIGFMGPAVFLVVAGLVGCDQTAAVAMICLASGINACVYAGYNSNHIDIASRYAGVLMGISNTWATIPGFVGPAVVGQLTEHHNTRQQWMIVFYIACGVYSLGTVAYLLLGSGFEQEWNRPGYQRVTRCGQLWGRTSRASTCERAPLIDDVDPVYE